jgi:hypothetical protein
VSTENVRLDMRRRMAQNVIVIANARRLFPPSSLRAYPLDCEVIRSALGHRRREPHGVTVRKVARLRTRLCSSESWRVSCSSWPSCLVRSRHRPSAEVARRRRITRAAIIRVLGEPGRVEVGTAIPARESDEAPPPSASLCGAQAIHAGGPVT